jgi:cytidylate kinase
MSLTIAIDGPSGAGKSTVARAVASGLGYRYVDTGAMYRAVAWRLLRDGVDAADPAAAEAAAKAMQLEFVPDAEGQRVFVDGTDVTTAIRSTEVTQLSSPVSAVPGVRAVLTQLQREMGAGGGVVMEGRDIGTVVCPSAEVKIFLTASDLERAARRFRERTSRGDAVTLEEILAQQRERDARDSSRDTAPLRPAEDAVELVSDGMTVDEVVSAVLQLVSAKLGSRK